MKKEDNGCKRIILFGAGKRGVEALQRYGKDKVAFFCDNSKDKQGHEIDGIIVISFDDLLKIYNEQYIIMITLDYPCFVIGQLEKAKIFNYILYQGHMPKIVEYTNSENEEEKAHNDILRYYIEESSKYDLLESITEFKNLAKKAIEEAKEHNYALNYKTRGDEEEGYRYGNLQTLLKYAGIEKKEGVYVPTVSHMLSAKIFTPIFAHKTSVIFSGDYYKNLIHIRAPWVPVFTVGPFIHYAQGIYDRNKMNEKKRNIGKMLLAFLPHTLENSKRYYDRKQFIDYALRRFRGSFDSIWLCVYFVDINDDVCEYAQNLGIHVVSAGFRFDPMFNDRLKSIIQLSDAVVCGDIGGFLTYSIYMKKPIARINISDETSILDAQCNNNIEKIIQKTDDCIEFERDFYRIFDENPIASDEHVRWMDSLAGYSLIRDKEYIRNIFSISEDIWNESEGNYRMYPDSVRKMYYKYNAYDDIEKMYILRQAVGGFLD